MNPVQLDPGTESRTPRGDGLPKRKYTNNGAPPPPRYPKGTGKGIYRESKGLEPEPIRYAVGLIAKEPEPPDAEGEVPPVEVPAVAHPAPHPSGQTFLGKAGNIDDAIAATYRLAGNIEKCGRNKNRDPVTRQFIPDPDKPKSKGGRPASFTKPLPPDQLNPAKLRSREDWLAAIQQAVSPATLGHIAQKLAHAALKGQLAAARILFEHLLPLPTQRLEVEEHHDHTLRVAGYSKDELQEVILTRIAQQLQERGYDVIPPHTITLSAKETVVCQPPTVQQAVQEAAPLEQPKTYCLPANR